MCSSLSPRRPLCAPLFRLELQHPIRRADFPSFPPTHAKLSLSWLQWVLECNLKGKKEKKKNREGEIETNESNGKTSTFSDNEALEMDRSFNFFRVAKPFPNYCHAISRYIQIRFRLNSTLVFSFEGDVMARFLFSFLFRPSTRLERSR